MYTAIYEKVPQGYIAWLEEVPGVLMQGKTKRETQENLRDAFNLFMLAQRAETRKEAKRGKSITREQFTVSR